MKVNYSTLKKPDRPKTKSPSISRLRGWQSVLAICLFFLCLSILVKNPAQAFQARQQVTGQVVDATTQETLPGVNILVQGTTIGTVTDMDGNFALEVPGPESVLVFSFVGYIAQEAT